MKNHVLQSYLKNLPKDADIIFQVPNKETRFNVTDVEHRAPSTIGSSGSKSKIILKGN